MARDKSRDSGSPLSRRQRILVVSAVVIAVLAVAGLIASTMVKSPAQEAADSKAPKPSVLTASVVRKVLTTSLVMRASFAGGPKQSFTPTSAATSSHGAPGSALVITGVKTKAGDTAKAGRVLLEVDERPIFALPGAFPAYRDMVPGDTGKDIEQLQDGLEGLGYTIWDTKGYFGASTKLAIQEFYSDIGYPPPITAAASADAPASGSTSSTSTSGSTTHGTDGGAASTGSSASRGPSSSTQPQTEIYMPMSEVAFLPRLPAQVAAINGSVGATVASPLISFTTGGLRLTADLDAGSASLVKKGMTAQIESESTGFKATATIDAIGTQATSSNVNGGNAYLPLSLVRDAAWPQSEAGDDVRVTITTASSGKAVLAVPEAAISSTADGQTLVTVETSTGTQDPVHVSVGVSAGGYVAVTPLSGAQLAPGTKVVTGS